jgi:uncharacterized membrane protein YhaH (DUF805 family)
MNLLRLLFSFSGRINRAKYWLGSGIVCLAAIVFMIVFAMSAYFHGPSGGEEEQWITLFVEQWTPLFIVFSLMAFVSTSSLMVKRLRDLAISAWWLLPIGVLAFGRFYTGDIIRDGLDFILLGVTVWLGMAKGKESKTSPVSQQENPDW